MESYKKDKQSTVRLVKHQMPRVLKSEDSLIRSHTQTEASKRLMLLAGDIQLECIEYAIESPSLSLALFNRSSSNSCRSGVCCSRIRKYTQNYNTKPK